MTKKTQPETKVDVIKQYQENPSPENAEILLKQYKPLISIYSQFLCTGNYMNPKTGKPWKPLRRLLAIIRPEWIPACFQPGYEWSDLYNEVRYCVLDVAKNKGFIVNAMPFRIKALIRSLTKDTSVRSTDFGDPSADLSREDVVDGNPFRKSAKIHEDDNSAMHILSGGYLSKREMFLAEQAFINGLGHAEVCKLFNKEFSVTLSRRTICSYIGKLRSKLKFILSKELGFSDNVL